MTKRMEQTDFRNIDYAADAIHIWANTTLPDRVPDSSLTKLVMEEIPELLQHKKEHGLQGIGIEWADCMILLLDLARLWNINIEAALRTKMIINANRFWIKDNNTGFYNHAKPARMDFSDAIERRERLLGQQAGNATSIAEASSQSDAGAGRSGEGVDITGAGDDSEGGTHD